MNNSKKTTEKEYVAWCISGLELVAIEEIKTLTKAEAKILIPGRLTFRTTIEKVCNLIYNTHSLIYVYELLEKSKIQKLTDINKIAKPINFKSIIKENFVVKCEREGKHEFKSIDIEHTLGALIHDNHKLPVNLENPTTTIFVDVLDTFCAIGIDLTGYKLFKRDYRVKLTSQPTNPCIAYSLIKIADWKPSESLLDAFTKSGEIPIEAALLATNTSPQKHTLSKLAFTRLYPEVKIKTLKEKKPKIKIWAADQIMPHIRNTEVNAKLAGVNKLINFTRLETEFLDSKFKKSSIDKIISFPPQMSNNRPFAVLEQTYKDFFYNAEYILKKQGTITLLIGGSLELITTLAEEYKFNVFNIIQFTYTHQDYTIVQLKKE